MSEKSIIGIDLRVSSVKAVELKKDAVGWSIIGFGMEEIPYELSARHPEKEIVQGKTLQKIISENNFKSKDAYVVVGGPDVLVKHLSMPALSRDETKQAIKWKIKDELGYPAEEAVIDFIPLGQGVNPQETDFFVVSIRAETINRIIQVINSTNLRLLSIIPVPVALKELFKDEIPQDKFVSFIYMGKRTTNISFYKGGKLYFNREIPIGGEDITRAMTSVLVSAEGRIELSYDEAEKIKKEQGVPLDIESYPKVGEIPTSHLYSLIRPAMEKLEIEIARTIEYLKMQEPDAVISKMIIVGGSSKTPHILEFLSKSLGISVEEGKTSAKVSIGDPALNKEKFAGIVTQLSCAIGSAMTFGALEGINLSPVEGRDKWKFLVRKHLNPVEFSAAFVVLLLLFYLVMAYIGVGLKSSVSDTQKKLAVLKPKLARLEELEKAMKEEEGRRGIFKSIELSRIKIPTVLEGISKNLPGSILIDNIVFVEKDKRVEIKGVVFGKGGPAENIISKFILNLSNAAVFEKVDLIQAVKTSGYLYEAYNFEIIGLVKKI